MPVEKNSWSLNFIPNKTITRYRRGRKKLCKRKLAQFDSTERIEIDETTHTALYGEFGCQPLERGFGTTLGNALRRVLLSSIQGAAIFP